MAQRGREVFLHSFANSMLEGGAWSPHSGCFTSMERTVVSIEVEVGFFSFMVPCIIYQ